MRALTLATEAWRLESSLAKAAPQAWFVSRWRATARRLSSEMARTDQSGERLVNASVAAGGAAANLAHAVADTEWEEHFMAPVKKLLDDAPQVRRMYGYPYNYRSLAAALSKPELIANWYNPARLAWMLSEPFVGPRALVDACLAAMLREQRRAKPADHQSLRLGSRSRAARTRREMAPRQCTVRLCRADACRRCRHAHRSRSVPQRSVAPCPASWILPCRAQRHHRLRVPKAFATSTNPPRAHAASPYRAFIEAEACHYVPAGPPAADVIERGHAPRERIGRIICGGYARDQTNPLARRGNRGQRQGRSQLEHRVARVLGRCADHRKCWSTWRRQ